MSTAHDMFGTVCLKVGGAGVAQIVIGPLTP